MHTHLGDFPERDRHRPPVTGLILAGGQGRRMGGQDKGQVLFRGRPLVQWVLERLLPQVDEIVISANRTIDRYADLGHPVIQDQLGGFAGPLAGLHAGLYAATSPWVMAVPCDAPFIPDDLVARLGEVLWKNHSGPGLAFVSQGTQKHPVFCLCRPSLAPSIKTFLEEGHHQVREWQRQAGAIEVAFDGPPTAFENVNTPADLVRWRA
jgi:molybdenum cofactor guanylyltransferase